MKIPSFVKALVAKVADLYQSEPAIVLGGVGTAAADVALQLGVHLTARENSAILAVAAFVFSWLIRRKVSPTSAPADPAEVTPTDAQPPAGA